MSSKYITDQKLSYIDYLHLFNLETYLDTFKNNFKFYISSDVSNKADNVYSMYFLKKNDIEKTNYCMNIEADSVYISRLDSSLYDDNYYWTFSKNVGIYQDEYYFLSIKLIKEQNAVRCFIWHNFQHIYTPMIVFKAYNASSFAKEVLNWVGWEIKDYNMLENIYFAAKDIFNLINAKLLLLR